MKELSNVYLELSQKGTLITYTSSDNRRPQAQKKKTLQVLVKTERQGKLTLDQKERPSKILEEK